jgi:hypothetical protein
VADDLSDDSAHKLYAALYYEWPSSNGVFLTEYREALERWFTALSKSERKLAAEARAAFDRGDDANARKASAALPPAPVCPLI